MKVVYIKQMIYIPILFYVIGNYPTFFSWMRMSQKCSAPNALIIFWYILIFFNPIKTSLN